MDIEMEQPELEKDIYLMSYHQEVSPPTSPDWEVGYDPSEQRDTNMLGDNPEEYMHNLSFNELHHRVLLSHKVSSLDDHKSPAHFEEWVIVSDTHKNPTFFVDAIDYMLKPLGRRTSYKIHPSRVEEGDIGWSIIP